MQLSNIARDVGEDARMGRLYLPRAWLADAGIDAEAWLAAPAPGAALASVLRRLLDEAERPYRRVDSGIALLPLDCRPGINAARFLYAGIGHQAARRRFDSVTVRARMPGWRKAWLLARAVAGTTTAGRATTASPLLAANGFLVDAAASGSAAGGGRHARRRRSRRLDARTLREPRPARAPDGRAAGRPAGRRVVAGVSLGRVG